MRHLTTSGAAVCLCALLAQGCGVEGVVSIKETDQTGERQAAITDGTLDSGHLSVGMLIAKGSTSCSASPLQGAVCTITLVGQRTLLTAAHCIHPGEVHIVCFDNQTTYKPKSLVPHSGWNSTTLENDIAVVLLDTPPPITPSIIARTPPTTGQTITLVGFGTTDEVLKDAGSKRIATNAIKDLWATRFSYAGTGGGVGNTCHGDSGGPAFSNVAGSEVQVGVTSAGLTPCGTLGYSTRVDAYTGWLEQVSGGDLFGGDSQKPQVTILEPADGATLSSTQLNVKASATDNVSVSEVELFVDGTSSGKLTTSPYSFVATTTTGAHVLKVVAVDAQGNSGEAQISVTVTGGSSSSVTPPKPSPTGTFGATCASNDVCDSKLCGEYNSVRYCTQACDDTAQPCPYGAECLPSTDGTSNVCGPPALTHALDGESQLVGGCRVAHGSGAGWWLALLLVLLARRRR
jgi:hypothetical protein